MADAARAQLVGTRSPSGEPRPRLGSGPGAQSATPAAATAAGANANPNTNPAPSPSISPGDVTVELLNTELELLLESVGARARAIFRTGRFTRLSQGRAVMSVANEATLVRAREVETELATAIAQRYGGLGVRLRSDESTEDADESADGADSAETPAPAAANTRVELSEDHEVDLDELVDAPADSGNNAFDQIAAAFPGAEIVE